MNFDLSVYLVLDPDQCGSNEKAVELAEKALSGGVTILQLRAPDWHKKALLELAKDLLKLARAHNIPFLINDQVDVALACDADGVHVGQRDLHPQIVRQLIGRNKIIGYSVSNKKEMTEANNLKDIIDYIGVGPVFSTSTKPDHNPPIGLEGLQKLCCLSKKKTVAIGGISVKNGVDILKTGVNGIAVVSEICRSEDPKNVSNQFAMMFKKHGKVFTKLIPNILTIAGSDSSGGAGIQADLKTFGALNVYGLSVLTTITAQTPQEVQEIFDLKSEFVRKQLDTVFDGMKIDSVKIGALANEHIIKEVSNVLKERMPKWIVLDPVLITTSGHRLLAEEAQKSLINLLFPLATLITPNLPEAASLLNIKMATNEEEMIEQGRQLLKLGVQAVLMKGGHLNGEECVDFLITSEKEVRFGGQRIIGHTPNGNKIDQFHGTGCTLSSAIAAFLVKTNGNLEESIGQAKSYLNSTILGANQLNIGPGPSPLNHFPNNP